MEKTAIIDYLSIQFGMNRFASNQSEASYYDSSVTSKAIGPLSLPENIARMKISSRIAGSPWVSENDKSYTLE